MRNASLRKVYQRSNTDNARPQLTSRRLASNLSAGQEGKVRNFKEKTRGWITHKHSCLVCRNSGWISCVYPLQSVACTWRSVPESTGIHQRDVCNTRVNASSQNDGINMVEVLSSCPKFSNISIKAGYQRPTATYIKPHCRLLSQLAGCRVWERQSYWNSCLLRKCKDQFFSPTLFKYFFSSTTGMLKMSFPLGFPCVSFKIKYNPFSLALD